MNKRMNKRKNPVAVRGKFHVWSDGECVGTFAGDTYEQAKFSAEQYYWTNYGLTLDEVARGELKSASAQKHHEWTKRRNPRGSKRHKPPTKKKQIDAMAKQTKRAQKPKRAQKKAPAKSIAKRKTKRPARIAVKFWKNMEFHQSDRKYDPTNKGREAFRDHVSKAIRIEVDRGVKEHFGKGRDPRRPYGFYVFVSSKDYAYAVTVIATEAMVKRMGAAVKKKYPSAKIAYEKVQWRAEID